MDATEAEAEAIDKYWQGDFAAALPGLLAAAAAGHADAMAMLANMYEAGEGVAPDWERSLEWARRAIAAGSVTALLNLGISYRRRGDLSAAGDCFQQASDRGDGEAELELAYLLLSSVAERPRAIELLQRVLASSNVSLDSLERARALLDELTQD